MPAFDFRSIQRRRGFGGIDSTRSTVNPLSQLSPEQRVESAFSRGSNVPREALIKELGFDPSVASVSELDQFFDKSARSLEETRRRQESALSPGNIREVGVASQFTSKEFGQLSEQQKRQAIIGVEGFTVKQGLEKGPLGFLTEASFAIPAILTAGLAVGLSGATAGATAAGSGAKAATAAGNLLPTASTTAVTAQTAGATQALGTAAFSGASAVAPITASSLATSAPTKFSSKVVPEITVVGTKPAGFGITPATATAATGVGTGAAVAATVPKPPIEEIVVRAKKPEVSGLDAEPVLQTGSAASNLLNAQATKPSLEGVETTGSKKPSTASTLRTAGSLAANLLGGAAAGATAPTASPESSGEFIPGSPTRFGPDRRIVSRASFEAGGVRGLGRGREFGFVPGQSVVPRQAATALLNRKRRGRPLVA